MSIAISPTFVPRGLACLGNALRRRAMLGQALVLFAAAMMATAPLAAAQTGEPREVVVSVPGPGLSLSMPLELAVKTGADRAEGIALRLNFTGGGGVALRDVQTGNAGFAVLGLPAVMDLHLKDPRIVALAAIDDVALFTLMVRSDLRGKVRSVQDLKGRTIGIFANTLATKVTSQQFAELLLLGHGVALDTVRLTAAGGNWETQSAMFASRSLDACVVDGAVAERLATQKIAFQLFSSGNPSDAKRLAGAGFLRGVLIGRRDRVDADPVAAERMVKTVKRTLEWMASRSPEQIADALGLPAGDERAALIATLRKYPRQFSRDGKFSAAQMRETEVFYRANTPDNPEAQRLSVETLIVDRWAGRKP